MNNKEQKIKEMYNAIDTPKYDVSTDVLNSINNSNKKYINKRVLIAAAIILSIFLLIGTAGATGAIRKWRTFDFFGNSTLQQEYYPSEITPAPTMPPSGGNAINTDSTPPVYQFSEAQDKNMSKFIDECKAGEIRIAVSEHGGGMNIGNIEFDNIPELKEYLENSSAKLPLPKYIPNGYSLEFGRIRFYVYDENMVELTSTEVIDGITYNVYKLADGFEKNICSVYLRYTNAGGNYLTYEIGLTHALSENSTFEIGAPESAVSKMIEIAGFEKGILIHDDEKANVTLNTLAVYKQISPIEALDIFNKLLQEIYETHDFSTEEVYDAMLCIIQVDDLKKNEVIKIAENIE